MIEHASVRVRGLATRILRGCCIPQEERDDAENAVVVTVTTDGAYRDIVDSVGDGPVRHMREAHKADE